MVAFLPISYHYGDNLSFSTQWCDEDGIPRDLTGYGAAMKVRDAKGVEVLFIDNDTQGGITIGGSPGWIIVTNVTPAQMIASDIENEEKTFYYDLQVKSPDETIVKTLRKGPFIVEEDITDV